MDDTPRKKQNKTYEFSFTGLSTDEKPTGIYRNFKIANGSTFLEMDTQKISFYDEEGQTWV
jgi:hypothetical protein